jgi:hypothetical protein
MGGQSIEASEERNFGPGCGVERGSFVNTGGKKTQATMEESASQSHGEMSTKERGRTPN